MNIAKVAAIGGGIYLLSKMIPSGKPHDKKINSFEDLKLGMSWSGTDGRQWKLVRINTETGNIEICAQSKDSPTNTLTCHNQHWSVFRSLLSDDGIYNAASA